MAKGVSNEEKLIRARNWLIKTRSFHNKVDLEKIMCKQIGISPMICGDIIQQLLDENMIMQERSKVASDLEIRNEQINKELAQVKAELASTAASGTDDMMIDVEETKAAVAKLEKELEKMRKNANSAEEMTTEYVDRLKQIETSALAAITKWTDNMFALIGWSKKKFFVDIRPQFKIPADLDYVE